MQTRIIGPLFLLLGIAGPASAQQIFPWQVHCPPTIRDFALPPDCMNASSAPMLGMLYPISEEWFVSPTGRIGFGTTSPISNVEITNLQAGQNTLTLALKASCPNGAVIELDNTDPAGGRDWALASWGGMANPPGTLTGKFAIYDATVGANRLVVDTMGRVGIGTTTPSELLNVAGNILASGTITQNSDLRFKTNVVDLEDALAKVLKLRGVEFDWRRDEFPDQQFSDARQVGLIAQEVRTVVPEIVAQGSDGYLSVDYAKLTPLLVEAIQTQADELTALRSANEELRGKLAGLEGLEVRLQRIEGSVATLAGTR